MIKVIIVSHNTLAKSLVETLEMIAGQKLNQRFHSFMVKPEIGISSYEANIQAFIDQNDSELLILCDLGYGSPISTLYFKLCETNINFRIISGVNMGMLLTAYTNLDKDLASLSELVLKEARSSINFCFENCRQNNDDE